MGTMERPRVASPLDRSRTSRKLLDRSNTRSGRHKLRLRRAFILIPLFCLVALYPALWFLSLPPPHFKSKETTTCSDGEDSYKVFENYVCTDSCGKICFPRVHGMCISQTEVTVCEDQPYLQKDVVDAGGGLPDVLRLITNLLPRAQVPVKRGICPGWDSALHKPVAVEGSKLQGEWIRGLQMVADVKLMPDGPNVGPNPHHEAEKLVPAILLSHLYGLQNATLHWFTSQDPSTVSRWSLGLLKVFRESLAVKFLNTPGAGEPQICFEDAILFSGLTNAGYIPGREANAWLRKKVLGFCKVPVTDASRPVKNVVVLERVNSSRSIANMEEVLFTLERELAVAPKVVTSGGGGFCDQVKLIADTDVVLTPHGSHNVNFLFARRFATVLEVFPLLYYIDWFGNYVHAANLNHYELYGTWLAEQGSMPFKMRMYANLYGWKNCFSTRGCMNYAKNQKVAIDIDQLEWLLKQLTSSCRIVVGEGCSTDIQQVSGKIENSQVKSGLSLDHRALPRWRKQHGWTVTQEILSKEKDKNI